MRKIPLFFGLLVTSLAAASAFPAVHITQLSAELEMRDFRDTATLEGPLKVGVPVTLTFKNHTKVTVIPVKIDTDTIKLVAHLVRGKAVLYDSTFFTHYNVDADLSEKKPNGDLVYRLKLDPQIQQ